MIHPLGAVGPTLSPNLTDSALKAAYGLVKMGSHVRASKTI